MGLTEILLLLMLQIPVPVVNSASFVEWDDGNPGITTETLVYLARAPGIVPDGNPTATIGTGLLEWAISAANGRWHAVVTARDPVSGVESGPSNEITFHVIGPPSNVRTRTP